MSIWSCWSCCKESIQFLRLIFAFCCNVAIGDDNKQKFFNPFERTKVPKKEGTAVIVVPSLESTFLFLEMIKVYEKEGVQLNKIPEEEFDHLTPDHQQLISKGILHIDGHPTKHYLFAELFSFFQRGKFRSAKHRPTWIQLGYRNRRGTKMASWSLPVDWVIEVKQISKFINYNLINRSVLPEPLSNR